VRLVDSTSAVVDTASPHRDEDAVDGEVVLKARLLSCYS
jgi:hypothetical protein